MFQHIYLPCEKDYMAYTSKQIAFWLFMKDVLKINQEYLINMLVDTSNVCSYKIWTEKMNLVLISLVKYARMSGT